MAGPACLSSPNQFLVLMALAETGQVCQQFLAGVIGIDPCNIVPILDSLEARALVARETDPADRRAPQGASLGEADFGTDYGARQQIWYGSPGIPLAQLALEHARSQAAVGNPLGGSQAEPA
jgi:hypothetical protein